MGTLSPHHAAFHNPRGKRLGARCMGRDLKWPHVASSVGASVLAPARSVRVVDNQCWAGCEFDEHLRFADAQPSLSKHDRCCSLCHRRNLSRCDGSPTLARGHLTGDQDPGWPEPRLSLRLRQQTTGSVLLVEKLPHLRVTTSSYAITNGSPVVPCLPLASKYFLRSMRLQVEGTVVMEKAPAIDEGIGVSKD